MKVDELQEMQWDWLGSYKPRHLDGKKLEKRRTDSLYFIIMEVPEKNPALSVPPSQLSRDHPRLELKDYILNCFFKLTLIL